MRRCRRHPIVATSCAQRAASRFLGNMTASLDTLIDLIQRSRHVVVLSGAGCSTESGLPDYRDRDGAWKRKAPMTYQEFMGSVAARQRYWARGSVGWRQFRDVRPGRAHTALAALEQARCIECLITQNVDGLHQRAGSRMVIDLHGRIDAVECLHCRATFPREKIQALLDALNPDWVRLHGVSAPDGDALLTDSTCQRFVLADCPDCRGPLKPAVVFFGEAVPHSTVSRAYEALENADALLVVGSSLMVYSGYRFVRRARERGLPVALVNLGVTRADTQVTLKIEANCGQILEQIVARLATGDAIGYPSSPEIRTATTTTLQGTPVPAAEQNREMTR
jgi:NAD-dependent SIR2 family protein deacetylase